MKPKFKDLVIENLRSVTTIDLTIKSVVFLEKIFWTSIGIVGTLFAIYFFSIQIQTWKENPTIVTKGGFPIEIETKIIKLITYSLATFKYKNS